MNITKYFKEFLKTKNKIPSIMAIFWLINSFVTAFGLLLNDLMLIALSIGLTGIGLIILITFYEYKLEQNKTKPIYDKME